MDRREYLTRAREFAPRGDALPQTKLSADDVAEIRNAVRLREIARAAIVREYSNAALAARFGVSVRAVERVLMRETHVQTGGA
jgi:hypothetical protein